MFMISDEHSYTEPEVGVKFCMINFSKLEYIYIVKCFYDVGIEALSLRS